MKLFYIEIYDLLCAKVELDNSNFDNNWIEKISYSVQTDNLKLFFYLLKNVNQIYFLLLKDFYGVFTKF